MSNTKDYETQIVEAIVASRFVGKNSVFDHLLQDKCEVWLALCQPNIILPMPVEFPALLKHKT